MGAVERVFIGGSNELGAFESGVAAALIGAVPAVAIGGILAIGAAALLGLAVPAAARVDRFEDAVELSRRSTPAQPGPGGTQPCAPRSQAARAGATWHRSAPVEARMCGGGPGASRPAADHEHDHGEREREEDAEPVSAVRDRVRELVPSTPEVIADALRAAAKTRDQDAEAERAAELL